MTGSGPQFEVVDKMRMIHQLSDQIAILRRLVRLTPTQTIALQDFLARRAAIQATLPPLKVV